METKIQVICPKQIEKESLIKAAKILKNGGLVAFPTETVYGLGGDGLNPEAAEKIYNAKGRPSDNPLIIHIGEKKELDILTKEIPEMGRKLVEAFWPGPLTLIFYKSEIVPYSTTGGLETIAIRMPNHPIALGLLKESGVKIAAPSANTSGKPSPTKASHVIEDLAGKIDMIIDGGEVEIGLESTIVDVTGDNPVILRPGFITKEMLEQVVGLVEIDKAILEKNQGSGFIPKAPGMKYKHYAPKGDLTIYQGKLEHVVKRINQEAIRYEKEGKKVGIIATEETKNKYHIGIIKDIGTREEEETIARGLYNVLREFDQTNVEVILTESFESGYLGQAIMNRLLKAAGYQVIEVKD